MIKLIPLPFQLEARNEEKLSKEGQIKVLKMRVVFLIFLDFPSPSSLYLRYTAHNKSLGNVTHFL